MTVIRLRKRFAKEVFWFRPKNSKMAKNLSFQQKWPKNENFWNFWVKKFLRVNLEIKKLFPCDFPDSVVFWPKRAKIVENWLSQKILVKIFFVGIDSEWFKTYSKPKISKSKIFPVQFFPGTLSSFWQNSVPIRRDRRSFQFGARLPNYRLQYSSACI